MEDEQQQRCSRNCLWFRSMGSFISLATFWLLLVKCSRARSLLHSQERELAAGYCWSRIRRRL